MRVGNGKAEVTGLSVTEKIRKLDLVGFFIFPASMISLLIGLIDGGTHHPWASWRIVLPIVVGFLGWMGFHVQQCFTE